MAISKLVVGGLKSLKVPVDIPLAPITLIFGPNSAGKSVVRDALLELKRRLAAPRVNDEFSAALARLGGAVRLDPVAHQLPKQDEWDETVATCVRLGCEDDDFHPNGSTDMAAVNEWTDLGRDLYFALTSKPIRYSFVDSSGEWTLAHELSVDGQLLMAHSSSEIDEGFSTWPNLPQAPAWLGGGDRLKTLGLLRLNLAHAVASDQRLQALAKRLTEAVDGLGPGWSGNAVWVTDRVLHVRVDAYRRLCQNWADRSAEEFGITPQPFKELDEYCVSLGALCFVVNELVSQLEWSFEQDLRIAYVPGSRTLLTDEMCSADWFSGGGLRFLETGLGHTVADYARWLGEVSIDKDKLKWDVSDDSRQKDDFVNDCMGGQLFSARKYRVRAEISVREEQMVAPRDATWSQDAESSMKSALYLLDEQGRALDFSQVGSGVSYLMPVLTALWGAQRSLIEQPELHLHPAAQCEVGDVIVRAFNRGRFSVVETHSEHLLLRILRRIRQTSEGKVQDRELQCQPEAVAVLYFAPDADGATQVHQLRVTRGGDFMDRWPDGFFEERSRELFDE